MSNSKEKIMGLKIDGTFSMIIGKATLTASIKIQNYDNKEDVVFLKDQQWILIGVQGNQRKIIGG